MNNSSHKKEYSRLRIGYINVNLNAIEIENLLQRYDIIFLVETHVRGILFQWSDHVRSIQYNRELDRKKGGGIMAIWEKDSTIEFDLHNSDNQDLMLGYMIIGSTNINLFMLICYWDTSDSDSNIKMAHDMNKALLKHRQEKLMVIGDFNAHFPWIDKRTNRNADILSDIMETNHLLMLNDTPKCEGTFTRIMNDSRTCIDYILANEAMYNHINSMNIDEAKNTDISDHNWIEVHLNINKALKTFQPTQTIYYWTRTNENKLNKFADEVSEKNSAST